MRMIILSALFAAGIGMASTVGATAAPAANGINNAAGQSSLLEQIQWRRGYRCRSVTVCRRGPYGRRCHTERICRR